MASQKSKIKKHYFVLIALKCFCFVKYFLWWWWLMEILIFLYLPNNTIKNGKLFDCMCYLCEQIWIKNEHWPVTSSDVVVFFYFKNTQFIIYSSLKTMYKTCKVDGISLTLPQQKNSSGCYDLQWVEFYWRKTLPSTVTTQVSPHCRFLTSQRFYFKNQTAFCMHQCNLF